VTSTRERADAASARRVCATARARNGFSYSFQLLGPRRLLVDSRVSPFKRRAGANEEAAQEAPISNTPDIPNQKKNQYLFASADALLGGLIGAGIAGVATAVGVAVSGLLGRRLLTRIGKRAGRRESVGGSISIDRSLAAALQGRSARAKPVRAS